MCAAAGHPVLRRDARRQSERSGVALPLGTSGQEGFRSLPPKPRLEAGSTGWLYAGDSPSIEPPDPSELVNEESPLVQPQALLIKKDWESSLSFATMQNVPGKCSLKSFATRRCGESPGADVLATTRSRRFVCMSRHSRPEGPKNASLFRTVDFRPPGRSGGASHPIADEKSPDPSS